jgi:hypothetical protein
MIESNLPDGFGTCDQCGAPVAINYCIDCDDNLCSDCHMFDAETDEMVCEACLTDREERDKREGETE